MKRAIWLVPLLILGCGTAQTAPAISRSAAPAVLSMRSEITPMEKFIFTRSSELTEEALQCYVGLKAQWDMASSSQRSEIEQSMLTNFSDALKTVHFTAMHTPTHEDIKKIDAIALAYLAHTYTLSFENIRYLYDAASQINALALRHVNNGPLPDPYHNHPW